MTSQELSGGSYQDYPVAGLSRPYLNGATLGGPSPGQRGANGKLLRRTGLREVTE